jgi:hypothetical protein
VTPTIPPPASVTPTPSTSLDCTSSNILEIAQAAALNYIKISIDYYKINLYQTKRNIYGESLEKWHYEPLTVRCTIERSPDTLRDEMFGPDVMREIKITVPQLVWEDDIVSNIQGVNTLPEIGDILRDLSTNRFYEVHNIVTLYTALPNSSYNPTQLANCANSDLVIYELNCYQTRVSRLNLLPYKII